MSASTLVRTARHGAGLTQRDLASISRKAQSVIARLEAGKASPRAGLLEDLVAACRFTLAVLPTGASPVADHAARVADRLAAGDERGAYRVVIQLADDLALDTARSGWRSPCHRPDRPATSATTP